VPKFYKQKPDKAAFLIFTIMYGDLHNRVVFTEPASLRGLGGRVEPEASAAGAGAVTAARGRPRAPRRSAPCRPAVPPFPPPQPCPSPAPLGPTPLSPARSLPQPGPARCRLRRRPGHESPGRCNRPVSPERRPPAAPRLSRGPPVLHPGAPRREPLRAARDPSGRGQRLRRLPARGR
jgi:hypothetical protein